MPTSSPPGRRPDRDRHGRTERADHDLRHRPADGFRTASGARFDSLVRTAVGQQAADITSYLGEPDVVVLDVPDEATLLRAELDGDMPLVTVTLSPDAPSRVQVHRRPIELRAASRADLVDILRDAIRDAVLDAIGRRPDES